MRRHSRHADRGRRCSLGGISFRRCLVEPLEDRRLLALGADPYNTISPAWFAAVDPPSADTLDAAAFAPGEKAIASDTLGSRPADRQAHEWIVRFSKESLAGIQTVAETRRLLPPAPFDFQIVEGLGLPGQVLLRAPTADVDAVGKWLAASGQVASFGPNAVLTAALLPDDAEFSQLWGLNNTGQDGGTADADIDAPEAWDLSTGTSEVVVGVIDTGIDYTHPDLAANIWTNPREIPGNGLDDDGNGFVDDVHGYDFLHNDGDPMDDNRHGTHVAGTIAAAGNNSTGVAGVNWSSSLMALKFLDAEGSGNTDDAIRALNYATMMRSTYSVNVRLTSNSWGGGGMDPSLYDAIAASGNAGILFVAAAGNSAQDNDLSPAYPASFDLENILSVAASDRNDNLANFSNYGATTVDLAAPGVGIYSTLPGGTYGSFSGTSMATPHVSGVAALAWATAPETTVAQMRAAILEGADPLASLAGKVLSGGRLNARGTLDRLGMNVAASNPAQRAVVSSPPAQFQIDFTDDFDPASLEAADLTVNGLAAASVAVANSNAATFTFDAPPVSAEGPQFMRIAAGAIRRAGDHEPIHAWEGVFYYDTLATTVVSSAPGEGQTVPAAPGEIVLGFNEPLLADTVGVDDLVLSSGTVLSAALVDPRTARYAVSGLISDGPVTYTLKNGALADAQGTPSAGYTGHFTIDDPAINRYFATDVPKKIPDDGTVTSTISIDRLFTISDVDVELDISHTWDDDLDVYLVTPDGTRIELFTDVGGGGDNFTRTVLDDEAETPIADAAAPFTGRFRPEGRLSDCDAFNAFGTWTLEVTDDYPEDVGVLNSWALVMQMDQDRAPRISSVQPLPADGGQTWAAIATLAVRFSEPMNADTVNAAANWRLMAAGPDRAFDTADDVNYALTVSPPYADGLGAGLVITGGPLPPGEYRFSANADALTDLAGDRLDGDGDGQPGGAYARRFTVMPSVVAFPFAEGFEAGSTAALGGYWELAAGPAGRVTVSSANGPHGGAYHLILDETAPYAGPQYATLHLDLGGQKGLALDFWHKTVGESYQARDDRVEISPDGRNWRAVVAFTSFNTTSNYQHHTVDLDRAVAEAGWNYTADFQIRFSQDNYYLDSGGFALDDVRVAALDLFGPRVIGQTPTELGAGAGSFNSLTVTFNEPIFSPSFIAADVVLTSPQGLPIPAVSVTPAAGDNTRFVIAFADQFGRGSYRLAVGPNINDASPQRNPMNQDGDSRNGEQGFDAYLGTIVFAPAAWTPPGPSPNLYAEGFENWPPAPGYWSFSTENAGSIQDVATDGPHVGSRHLRFSADGDYPTQSAILQVDLAAQTGRDDLFLTFWAKYANESGTLWVDLSGDGAAWKNVAKWETDGDLTTSYAQFTLDLDQLAGQAGIALDGDLFFRFRDEGTLYLSEHDLFLDEVRVVAGDLQGPKVTAQSPVTVAAGAESFNAISLVFDKPIDPATFTTADVVLVSPVGNTIGPVTVTPAAGGGNTRFDLAFAGQTLRGTYRLAIGPNLTDASENRNPMNQDGDWRGGEPEDAYRGTVEFAPTAWTPAGPAPNLYVEDFENWSPVPSYWSFQTENAGTIQTVLADGPHGGARHLRFDANGDQPTQSAAILVDLAAQAQAKELYLSFWAKSTNGPGTLYLDLSNDGSVWRNVASWASGADLPTSYTNYTLDLVRLVGQEGIALDGDVYLRFRDRGEYAASLHDLFLDDVRIVAGDLAGPRITGQTPLELAGDAGPFNAITLTFSEPIDPASFTTADVALASPQNKPISPAAVTPVAGSDDTRFTITFADQTLRGVYRLTVGPNITDASPARNRMNQDGDWTNGESAGDAYAGTVRFAPAAWTPPGPLPNLYAEGFETWSPAPSYWSLETENAGTIQSLATGLPHAGARHLVFDAAGDFPTQSATLVVDLASQAGQKDLFLTFWAKYANEPGTLYVDLSGDGAKWSSVASWSSTGGLATVYTKYTLDLAQLTAGQGIALDGDVYVRFCDYGDSYSSTHDLYLDDVRVVSKGPAVLSHTPSGTVLPAVSTMRFAFDERMDPTSFSPADDVAAFTGPLGELKDRITGFAWLDGDRTLAINFQPQSAPGVYELVLGPGLANVSGKPMDQDGDGVTGEAADDRYTAGFQILAVVYAANMDVDPGWTFDAGSGSDRWQWGVPQGKDDDPAAGYTGSHVIGYNLAGAYPDGMTKAQYATTPAIDTRGYHNLTLKFYRWLGVESAEYDHAKIQVSNNGVTWVDVWNHTGDTMWERTWSLQQYALPSVADNRETVYLRWGMGPTDDTLSFSGWNIDDVWLTGPPVDVTPPTVTDFVVNGGVLQRSTITSLAIQFSENVATSLDSGDLSLVNRTTGKTIDLAGVKPTYDAATNRAVWNLSGIRLVDGYHTATLSGKGIADAAGNLLGAEQKFEFFRLACDTDGDAWVNIFDVAKVQVNFGRSGGMTPAQGDFDGDGDVDVFDVYVLQAMYGTVLAPPPAPMPSETPTAAPAEMPGAMASLAWRVATQRPLMDSAATRGWPCAAGPETTWPLKAGDLSPWKDVTTAASALRGHGTQPSEASASVQVAVESEREQPAFSPRDARPEHDLDAKKLSVPVRPADAENAINSSGAGVQAFNVARPRKSRMSPLPKPAQTLAVHHEAMNAAWQSAVDRVLETGELEWAR
ncbi:MAG: S8 family serine peptidase [Pirellulales bacterium]